jgi:hypothetical protein
MKKWTQAWRDLRNTSTALAVLLALIAAPLCRPMCATQACASTGRTAGAGDEDCHHVASDAGSQQIHIHAVRTCGSRGLQAAALSTRNSLPQVRRASALHAIVARFESQALASINRLLWLNADDGPGPLQNPTATTILRI